MDIYIQYVPRAGLSHVISGCLETRPCCQFQLLVATLSHFSPDAATARPRMQYYFRQCRRRLHVASHVNINEAVTRGQEATSKVPFYAMNLPFAWYTQVSQVTVLPAAAHAAMSVQRICTYTGCVDPFDWGISENCAHGRKYPCQRKKRV
jgi:hypothetical protein